MVKKRPPSRPVQRVDPCRSQCSSRHSDHAVADVLQLLQHLPRAAVQLLGHRALLLGRQLRELLAQVAINHVLHREVEGAAGNEGWVGLGWGLG